ncbi:hypothetical protein ZWY2020_011521 [Hordeum vulgare]|nr:hypothetical protein ZWY2020_011521 [Hordeum vulgare]
MRRRGFLCSAGGGVRGRVAACGPMSRPGPRGKLPRSMSCGLAPCVRALRRRGKAPVETQYNSPVATTPASAPVVVAKAEPVASSRRPDGKNRLSDYFDMKLWFGEKQHGFFKKKKYTGNSRCDINGCIDYDTIMNCVICVFVYASTFAWW